MSILDVLPQQCVLCGDTLHRQTEFSISGICNYCRQDLPWSLHACLRCGVELGTNPPVHGHCGSCLTQPPNFDRCIAPFRYDFPIRELIASFKFNARLAEGESLARLLAEFVMGAYDAKDMPHCLLPVPLHPRRLRERGYNQSMELARSIARRCRIPVTTGYCRRIRSTPPQRGLTADERATNLHNAFALQSDAFVDPPRRVAIVDDVVTTMATVSAIAHLLRSAGHSRIDVICLARVS